jgi:hypothetical protein
MQLHSVPDTEDDELAYVSLFAHLNSKNRCGAVGQLPSQIKVRQFLGVPLNYSTCSTVYGWARLIYIRTQDMYVIPVPRDAGAPKKFIDLDLGGKVT